MEKTTSITNLAKALMLFQLKVSKIEKDSRNPFYNSKYASLSNIQEAIYTPLAESGLVYSQSPSGLNGLTTIVIHAETGEYFMDTYTMPVSKQNDPQAVGSSITYAKRYALVAILGLNIDDDDDGNAGSVKPEPKKQEEDNRPWLSDKAFAQALERVQSGDKDVFTKTKEAFKIKKDFYSQLKEANDKL
jgi:hypothetical protein